MQIPYFLIIPAALFLFLPSITAFIRKIQYRTVCILANLFLPILAICSLWIPVIGWLCLFLATILAPKEVHTKKPENFR